MISGAHSSQARLVVRQRGRVVSAQSLRFTTGSTIVRRQLGRLARGHYTLAIIDARGRHARTVLRLAFQVR